MSREQQIEQQHGNRDGAEQERSEPESTFGLPDFVFHRVHGLGPHQEAELVQLLRQFPAFREQICNAAAGNMSGRTIRSAADMAVAKDSADAAAATPLDPTQDPIEQIWAQRFDLQLEVSRLTPSEAGIEKLALLIRQQPQYRTQILRTARPNMGDDGVREAVSEARQADVARDAQQDEARKARKDAEAGKSSSDKAAEARKDKDQEQQWAASDHAESEQYKKDREASEWLQQNHPDTLAQLNLMGRDVENVAYMLNFNDDATKEHIRHLTTVRYGEGFMTQVEAKRQANHGIARPIDVASARKYNAAHADLVQRFLVAVRDEGFVGESGEIDPIKVAAFQSARGVGVDGKVGTHTISAAHEYAAQSKGEGLE
jgi:hypothetical protein